MDEQNEQEPEQPQPSSQGASTDLGPRPKPGGEQEPGGLVPPYEGRQEEWKEGHDPHMDKVFNRVDEVPPGPGREISEEEREGVPPTDTEATSPLGVGESINRRGEDVVRQEGEAGREHAGSKGPTDRPHGVSDERDSSSVDPDETQTGGPHMPAGDQGG
ncbi:MAG TPA: hypothetical protein VJ140_14640 [Actinomycetota bacterium]|nr:hypothetical protein [Actinomycetota bacterium]